MCTVCRVCVCVPAPSKRAFHRCFALTQVVLGFVCEGDFKLVAKAIRDLVSNIKRHREKLRRLAEEQRRQQQQEGRRRKEVEEEEQQQQQHRQRLQATLEEERSLEESPVPVPGHGHGLACRTPTPTPTCQTSPVTSGSASSLPAELEEPEVDQHFHIRHNSCSSVNCEPPTACLPACMHDLPKMHLTSFKRARHETAVML